MAIVAFVQAHQVVLVGLAVAVLDFLIEVNPKLASNSIISAILSLVKKPAPPSA